MYGEFNMKFDVIRPDGVSTNFSTALVVLINRGGAGCLALEADIERIDVDMQNYDVEVTSFMDPYARYAHRSHPRLMLRGGVRDMKQLRGHKDVRPRLVD